MDGTNARVAIWAAADLGPLERRARRRDDAPPPLHVEDVEPGVGLTIGRRRSRRDELRNAEDGTIRVALDQREQPYTSKKHIAIDGGDSWTVHVLDGVNPVKMRAWGELTWGRGAPGLNWPLLPDRPQAILLPGVPGYIVSVTAPRESTPPTISPPSDPSDSRTADVPSSSIRLQRTEVVTLVRSFRMCVQWPPRSEDDDDPAWIGAGLRNPEALRMAYRRLFARMREPLGLPERQVRGADLQLMQSLVEGGSLTLGLVDAVAPHCDLDLLTSWVRAESPRPRPVS